MDIKDVNESIVFSDKTFTKRTLFVTKDVLCFILNMKPGQTLPVHKHENSSLIFIVLSGAGEVRVNDDIVRITQGSAAYVKGQDDFSIPTVSEDLTLFVTISPNPANELYAKNLG